MPRFYEYEGDLIGLPTDDRHIVFRWLEPDCKVLFSVARLGDGVSCHLASDKSGLRKLKQAINEFFTFLMKKYEWCRMVIAKAKLESVCRLIKKCDFKAVVTVDGITAYARCRNGWNN